MAAAGLFAGRVMPTAPSPPFARLFFALWPDAGTRERWAACRQAWRWPRGARPTPADRLHLTLHFLARVPREQVGGLMQRVDVPTVPFDLVLDRAGTWPTGIAWLKPSVAPPELLELHRRIGGVLLELGVELESRRYEPHVTLARDAWGAVPPSDVELGWCVDGYALVESRLGAAGEYEVLRDYRAS